MSRNFDIPHRETTRASGSRQAAGVGPAGNQGTDFRNLHAFEPEIAKLVQRTFILSETVRELGAVAFCGVDKGAGCSWVCARASEVLAQQVPGRVCVIDANLRSPSLHEHFGFGVVPGFADAMKDSGPVCEFVRPTWCSHLWIMTAGTVDMGPAGSLNPARLRARVSELRHEFDHLLIDTPPLGAYTDALLVGQLTDGVILVVGSNLTRREPTRIAKENLEAARVPVLGAVLNRRTFPIPEALYQRL